MHAERLVERSGGQSSVQEKTDIKMTKETFLVLVVLVWLVVFFFWRPSSTALKWSGLLAVLLIAMTVFDYIPD